MYSRKSEGPRMEPWGTPTLTGYSCEDFPSRTTWSCLLLRKEEIRPNIWPEIPKTLFVKDLSFWKNLKDLSLKKTSMPNPVKSLEKRYHSCYGWKWYFLAKKHHTKFNQNIWYLDKIKSFWKFMIWFCYFCKNIVFFCYGCGPWGLHLGQKMVIFRVLAIFVFQNYWVPMKVTNITWISQDIL